jgi:hypothetical protein
VHACAEVLQKSIKLINKFFGMDLDVIGYGEFKYDLKRFLGSPPSVVGAAKPGVSIIGRKI